MSVLTESEISEILDQEGLELAPLRVRKAIQPDDGPARGDALLELEWDDTWRGTFRAEITAASTPRALEAAIAAALRNASDERYPLVIAPYLSPEALERCLAREVSGIDLSGNAAVVVPGELAVYRTGFPNEYPASRPIKAIYQGKSSLVPRVFLLEPRFEYVQDIQKAIEERGASISLGTVSKVLKGLTEDLVVEREPRIAVIQPGRLLDRLADSYDRDRVDVDDSIELKLDLGPDVLRRLRRAAEEAGLKIAAGTLGDADPVPESGPLPIYVEKIEPVLAALGVEPVRRFATVELIQSGDPRVYFDRREQDGFYWASPIQRYLELAAGGKRETELSGILRDRVLAGLPDA